MDKIRHGKFEEIELYIKFQKMRFEIYNKKRFKNINFLHFP